MLSSWLPESCRNTLCEASIEGFEAASQSLETIAKEEIVLVGCPVSARLEALATVSGAEWMELVVGLGGGSAVVSLEKMASAI